MFNHYIFSHTHLADNSESHLYSPEVSGILELNNVWVFVQLIFGPHWPMNQLRK